MLSKRSQWLTYVCALLYAILGVMLFIAPEAMSSRFTWNVSPLVTMTIGGWSLGTAWCALFAARHWQWEENHCSALYFWLFGISETLVPNA